MALRDDILAYLAQFGPTTDRKLADAHHTTNQHVNQIARGMVREKLIRRDTGPDGLIRNVLSSAPPSTARRPRGSTERVIDVLREGPATDAEIAGRLGLRPQEVHQITERLCRTGRADKGNVSGVADRTELRECIEPVPVGVPSVEVAAASEVRTAPLSFVTEDEVKTAVGDYLKARGWTVEIAWGRSHGIDIEAFRDGRRLILEAKGDCASQPQQTNYFLGATGELAQRMSDPGATYGLALPDSRTFRGLVSRLPALTRERLVQVVYFVKPAAEGFAVELDDRSGAG